MAKQPDDPFEQMGAEIRASFGLSLDEAQNRRFAKFIWALTAIATAVVLWSAWLTLVRWS